MGLQVFLPPLSPTLTHFFCPVVQSTGPRSLGRHVPEHVPGMLPGSWEESGSIWRKKNKGPISRKPAACRPTDRGRPSCSARGRVLARTQGAPWGSLLRHSSALCSGMNVRPQSVCAVICTVSPSGAFPMPSHTLHILVGSVVHSVGSLFVHTSRSASPPSFNRFTLWFWLTGQGGKGKKSFERSHSGPRARSI